MSLSFRKNDAYFLLILCAAAAILIALTWHRWGDVVVDCGKDLIAAARIAGGEVLYRDIQYNYGPFSPYLRGFLFSILGVNMGAAVTAGITSLISAILLSYFLARRLLPGVYSFFFAFTFLLICALPQYNGAGGYNFIIPYAAPAVDGFNLSLLSLLFLLKYLETATAGRLAAGALLTALLSLTKIEFAVASFAAWIFALVSSGGGFRSLLIFSAFSIIPTSAIYAIFSFYAGIENLLLKNIFPIHIATAVNFLFPRLLMGTADIASSIEASVKSLALFAAATAASVLTASSRFAVWIITATFFALISHIVLEPHLIFRFLPPLISFVFLYCAVNKKTSLASLSIFSMIITVRVFLNLGAYHFGFYLLPFPLLVLYLFIFREISEKFVANNLKFRYGAFMIAFLIAAYANHLIISASNLADKSHRISGRNGWLYVEAARAEALSGAMRFLAENGAEGDALISIPEGALINFLTGLRHISYYSSFVPPEIPSEAEEGRVLKDIETGKPRFAAVISRDVSEFGSAGFGVDYGLKIFDLLKKKYVLKKSFESADGSFWVRIFLRKD